MPEGDPEEFYELKQEDRTEGEPDAIYSVKLPPMSLDFQFQARLGGGRTKQPGHVRFETPPQLADDRWRRWPCRSCPPTWACARRRTVRPPRPGRRWKRGEVIDALPGSQVLVEAKFNKPVKIARLIPIERAIVGKLLGIKIEVADVRLFGVDPSPGWLTHLQVRRCEAATSATSTGSIPYPKNRATTASRPRGASRPRRARSAIASSSRTIAASPTRSSSGATFACGKIARRSSLSGRNRRATPTPTARDGKGNPRDYEWDMPVGPDRRVQVIFNAHSDVGIRAANILYRVIPKGVQMDLYPEEYKRIQHPREDVNGIVYNRLPLKLFSGDPVKLKLGKFVADLGKFEQSGKFGEVELYPFPPRTPAKNRARLDAASCKLFETSGLLKKLPDGTTAKLQVGDTVELYVEVFDRLPGPDGKPDPNRPAGYTREAKRKIVMTETDVQTAAFQRDEARQRLRDKLQDIANDQVDVFKPKR